MKLLTPVVLAASLVFGIAAAQADVISTRKAGFKQNADQLKAINNAIGAGDFAAIEAAANIVASWSREMTAYFPEGSDEGDTKARPEIWFEWEKFESLAAAAQKNALALAALAKAGDQDALPGALKELGSSCKACHSSFKD